MATQKIEQLNIRPTTSVYSTYQRLSYTHPAAISEFVDNSTQSFFNHQKELESLDDFDQLSIQIEYNGTPGDEHLSIIDNAYGMEREDFERAIILDSPPKDRSGRSEFGMGLKTAACWYGKLWSVETTQYGSKNLYKAVVDVSKLAQDKSECIDISIEEIDPESHYTTITIEKLHNKITGGRTVESIKSILGSTYREDLRTSRIQICYNGNELFFEEPAVYCDKLEDGSKKVWRKDVKFSVKHEGKVLPVRGFIAIRDVASVKDAGFALLRRGRVIVGGGENNYRPREIFGQPNTFVYQRLFGELHMDDWPVTQAKDNFDWNNSGLEESFIEILTEVCKEYKEKASNIRKHSPKKEVNTGSIVKQVATSISQSGVGSVGSIKNIPTPNSLTKEYGSTGSNTNQEIPNYGAVLEGPDTWSVPFTHNGVKYIFNIQLVQDRKRMWLVVKNTSDDHYTISLNVAHKFFEPFAESEDFIKVITRFVIAMVLAEADAKRLSTDDKIEPTAIRMRMNKILDQLGSVDKE